MLCAEQIKAFSSSEVDPLEILRHTAPRSQGRITFKE